MNDLTFSDQIKILDKYIEWCEDNGNSFRATNFFVFMLENNALNIENCKKIIKDYLPITDELSVNALKESLQEVQEQKDVLQSIVDNVSKSINLWGSSGRLIDRATVIDLLEGLRTEATNALQKF